MLIFAFFILAIVLHVITLTLLRGWGSRTGRWALAWFGFLSLMTLSVWASWSWQPWVRLICVWIAMFVTFKGFVVLAATPELATRIRGWRWWAFMLGWLGMELEPWADSQRYELEAASYLRAGAGLIGIGGLLGIICLFQPGPLPPLVWAAAFWVALVVTLFFGFTRFLTGVWRVVGVGVEPLFEQPVYARNLADWWGRRWNRAVHRVLSVVLWKPLGRWPTWLRLALVFGASGLIHEVLLSYPASGGWGLPSAYFAIQIVGMLLERARPIRRWLRGTRRAVWTLTWTVLPAPLLFHPPLLQALIEPFLF